MKPSEYVFLPFLHSQRLPKHSLLSLLLRPYVSRGNFCSKTCFSLVPDDVHILTISAFCWDPWDCCVTKWVTGGCFSNGVFWEKWLFRPQQQMLCGTWCSGLSGASNNVCTDVEMQLCQVNFNSVSSGGNHSPECSELQSPKDRVKYLTHNMTGIWVCSPWSLATKQTQNTILSHIWIFLGPKIPSTHCTYHWDRLFLNIFKIIKRIMP